MGAADARDLSGGICQLHKIRLDTPRCVEKVYTLLPTREARSAAGTPSTREMGSQS